MTERTIDTEKCRGCAELCKCPEYHEFRLYLQTCDPELVNRIRNWIYEPYGGYCDYEQHTEVE